MDFQLQVGHFDGPGSDYGARGSSWPPLGCRCCIHIHHSGMSLPKGCFTALTLPMNTDIHPVQTCPYGDASGEVNARLRFLETVMLTFTVCLNQA